MAENKNKQSIQKIKSTKVDIRISIQKRAEELWEEFSEGWIEIGSTRHQKVNQSHLKEG